MQEVDGRGGSGQSLAVDTGKASALAADGDIEALIAFFAQLRDGHVLAHFHSRAYLHANLAHNVDLGLDNVLV